MIGTAPENERASVPILRARRRCHPVPFAQAEHNLCDGGTSQCSRRGTGFHAYRAAYLLNAYQVRLQPRRSASIGLKIQAALNPWKSRSATSRRGASSFGRTHASHASTGGVPWPCDPHATCNGICNGCNALQVAAQTVRQPFRYRCARVAPPSRHHVNTASGPCTVRAHVVLKQ